ncbi:MAG TPA: hypothetical protein VJ142_00280 [Candidatus Nanoarchaeia archaeon]|nr:hypothetical protein [Candidatus Nanoarchaeia archaeon]
MEKFLENVQEAEKNLRTIDHIVYVTFPLIKDKRLLLKVIQDIKGVVTHCITSILQYEYLYKRISLHRDSRENFKTFTEKCAVKYNISKEEIRLFMELAEFVEKHKASPFEFVKEEKIVILSENSKPTTLTLGKTKEFLIMAKDILRKTKEGMKSQF